MFNGRRQAASSDDDARLSRLYQQLTEQQAARFAADYDMAAGLDRYKAWLDEQTVDDTASSQADLSRGPAADRHLIPPELWVAAVVDEGWPGLLVVTGRPAPRGGSTASAAAAQGERVLLHLARCSSCRDEVESIKRRMNALGDAASDAAGLTGLLTGLRNSADGGVQPQAGERDRRDISGT